MTRDLNYELRIANDTGRRIEQQPIDCPACQGRGENPWEQPCTGCKGEGQILEYFFNDSICQDEVAMCDCPQAWQDGDKGFVVRVDADEAERLWKDELDLHLLRATMRRTDHLATFDERCAA